jgi:hypothetical protein
MASTGESQERNFAYSMTIGNRAMVRVDSRMSDSLIGTKQGKHIKEFDVVLYTSRMSRTLEASSPHSISQWNARLETRIVTL